MSVYVHNVGFKAGRVLWRRGKESYERKVNKKTYFFAFRPQSHKRELDVHAVAAVGEESKAEYQCTPTYPVLIYIVNGSM